MMMMEAAWMRIDRIRFLFISLLIYHFHKALLLSKLSHLIPTVTCGNPIHR